MTDIKKLVIAEKPSLGRNITNAIEEPMAKKDGYYEGSSYIVTYAFGHLFGLADMNVYLGKEKGRWEMADLPFCPEKFSFTLKPDDGIKKQFETIEKLINRPDVEAVIHCGDSDREGEVIVRLIIQNAMKTKKPVLRLWLPEQTEEGIRNGLDNCFPDEDKDDLYREGLARTYIDWLYGINLTRYLSIKAGNMLRVGRVLVPIVKAIYDRETEIESFTPEKYLTAESPCRINDIPFCLTSKKTFSCTESKEAQKLCRWYNEEIARVIKTEKGQSEKHPGKLFSLSKLQGLLSKRYKIAPKDSLEAIQKLYEKGLVTYPRTNTEYLAEGEKQRVKKLIRKYQAEGYSVEMKETKRIFDDTKIESHSALTPTGKNPEELTGTEKTVYDTIVSRFLAVFCSKPCIIERTTVTVQVQDEQFILKGEALQKKGYLIYEDDRKKDKILPPFREGDTFPVHFIPTEHETAPPNRYTVETLSSYLKNPFRKSGSEEEEYKAVTEGLEIGTEATRTAIIENARANHYIALNGNIYTLCEGGRYLVEALKCLEIDMSSEKTVYMSKLLKKVYQGELKVSGAVAESFREIKSYFDQHSQEVSLPPLPDELKSEREEIGTCPICGGSVQEGRKNYYCGNRECSFALWKEDRYFQSLGCKITKSIAKSLLKNGQVKMNSLVSKKGTKYAAIIKADFSEEYPKYSMEFPSGKKKRK